MPYTPPAQLSLATSNLSSPSNSRSPSYLAGQGNYPQSISSNVFRNAPPRSLSSSYLTMHRRSPSASSLPPSTSFNEESSTTTKTDRLGDFEVNGHASDRQLPPLVNDSSMPTNAVVSPSEFSHNSSDEEETGGDRGRQLANLAELEAAIRTIEQRKERSPEETNRGFKQGRLALDLVMPESRRASEPCNPPSGSQRPPLSKEARKISHSRSSTDSNLVLDITRQPQSAGAMPYTRSEPGSEDEDSDETGRQSRPAMLRKKSGELVRPALRPSSCRRRPSSMPGTPTYSKAVHFDAHLEHVRHFLQVDKPLAVSAGSSPVEAHHGEMEFPFGAEESGRPWPPSHQWEIRLLNFPVETPERRQMAVRVERLCLSSDNHNLVGTVAVQNLAYRKQVTARFTLDYWKTTSEVTAEYNNDVRRKDVNDGCDRFNFFIKLADQANLENKTMFFCVRYDIDGQQYWDNNNSVNYQVDFVKNLKGHGRNDMTGLGATPSNALPRSRLAHPLSAGSGWPKSTPRPFDDFASSFDPYSQSSISMAGDNPVKLKSPQECDEIVPDAPARRPRANAPAFGNRYDFGASLSAAIQNASGSVGEQDGPPKKPTTEHSSRPTSSLRCQARHIAQSNAPSILLNQSPGTAEASSSEISSPTKPSALLSGKSSLKSQSYQELVDKYCFFGSAKPSPQANRSTPGQADGTNRKDEPSVVGDSTESDPSSPTESTESTTEVLDTPQPATPPLSRSSSPTTKAGTDLGARKVSSVAFHYSFHQSLNTKLFDAHTATAIQG